MLRRRVVMPCASCTMSPCRTGLGGLFTTSWCLQESVAALTGRQGPRSSLAQRGIAQPPGHRVPRVR